MPPATAVTCAMAQKNRLLINLLKGDVMVSGDGKIKMLAVPHTFAQMLKNNLITMTLALVMYRFCTFLLMILL